MPASPTARWTSLTLCALALLLATQPGVGQTYSNGPYVTTPGAGPLPGTDASVKTISSIALGYGCQLDPANNLNLRITDDFNRLEKEVFR